ncbi:MAG: exopolysaccharide biosynthesis polyprenyl glycosylphosphotransferase [uncultured bacterium]|nr:MAG: exopolysaccharide biosynthesis polyprenyl glycosylphosphotransferase [uncultured bacterium]
MSIVGPRPPMPQEVELYSANEKKRLGVKPGITGLWQVSGRSNTSFDEWVRLDIFYIENWSLWLDISIMVKTLWAIVKKRGAY